MAVWEGSKEEKTSEGLTAQEATIGAAAVGKLTEEVLRNQGAVAGASPLWGKFADAIGNASDAALYYSGVSENLTKNVTALVKAFDLTNIDKTIKSLTDTMKGQIKAYQELDQEFIKLGRGTDSKQYIENIRQQEFVTARLGVAQSQLVETYKQLIANYTGASLIVPRQTQEFEKNKQAISELVLFNQKFAISQDQSIQLLNIFNRSMEGGSKAAQKLSDNLLIFATRTGQDAGKVFSEFNANIDRFVTMGADKAGASFQKLELFAKRTGESVSTVISAVERFDDIESGFQAGGQLNRVLSFMGGSFDTFKALQASDEERAQMLYQAIASTGDRFQQLQTEGAKRQMAKQIAESSGIDIKTVMGLLNKSTNLAADFNEISKRPPVTEEFTERGRVAAAMRATTAEELKKVQDQLLDMNPLIANLSDNVKGNTEKFTNFSIKFAGAADESFRAATAAAKNADGFLGAAKTFISNIGNLPTAFKQSADEFNKSTREQSEGILSRNTDILTKLHTAVDVANKTAIKKVEVSVDVKTQPGTSATAKANIPLAPEALMSMPVTQSTP